MWDMDLNVFNFLNRGLTTGTSILLLFLPGCDSQPPAEVPRQFQLTQKWELQPGDTIAEHQVLGGLGDISIDLNGKPLYAPYNGRLQPHNSECAIFSSEEIAPYLLRICGLRAPKYGPRLRGESIATGNQVQLALLNKQANGQWAMVEPSREMIEQMLQQP